LKLEQILKIVACRDFGGSNVRIGGILRVTVCTLRRQSGDGQYRAK
jgi:hypothetical protein